MTASSSAFSQSGALDPSKPEMLNRWLEAYELLAEEVHLLDDWEYTRWLELFTDVCLYWMPVHPLSCDGAMRLNVFYDDRARMEDRIARLTSGSAYTEEPQTLTTRTFSAIQVSADDQSSLLVRSNFQLVAHRRGDQRHLAGRYMHRLIRQDGRLRIAEKRVVLLGSDTPQRPMTFLF